MIQFLTSNSSEHLQLSGWDLPIKSAKSSVSQKSMDISLIDLHFAVDSSPQSHAWSGPGRPVLGDATFTGVGRWTTDFLLKYLDGRWSKFKAPTDWCHRDFLEMIASLKNLFFIVYTVYIYSSLFDSICNYYIYIDISLFIVNVKGIINL